MFSRLSSATDAPLRLRIRKEKSRAPKSADAWQVCISFGCQSDRRSCLYRWNSCFWSIIRSYVELRAPAEEFSLRLAVRALDVTKKPNQAHSKIDFEPTKESKR